METFDIVLEIIQIGLGIIGAQFKGAKLDIPNALVRIVSAAYAAYEKQVGQPIDPSLIKPYEPLTPLLSPPPIAPIAEG